VYGYVGGDPVNAVDPSGLKEIDWVSTGQFGLIAGAGDALGAANRGGYCFNLSDFLLNGALVLALGPEFRGAGLLKNLEVRGGAYALRGRGGAVMRTGRSGNLAQREKQHARDPSLKDLTFDPMYKTDNYAKQRGLEQILHDLYNPPLNKIKPISPRNPNLDHYMDEAKKFLGD
jgi:hypothetical protein